MAGLRGHAPVSIHTLSLFLFLFLPIHSIPPLLFPGCFLALALVAPVRNFVFVPFIFPSGQVRSVL